MSTRLRNAPVVSHVLSLFTLIAATSFAAGPPTVQITVPTTPPIQLGGAPSQFRIAVTNDAAGDQPTVTSFTLNGAPCTPATCGSFGPVSRAGVFTNRLNIDCGHFARTVKGKNSRSAVPSPG